MRTLLLKKIFTTLFFQLSIILSWGQNDSCWSVLLLQKGKQLEEKPDMASFSKTGFYLFRNCIYEIDLKNKKHISGRLIDMQPETLFLTNFFNTDVAERAQMRFETLAVNVNDLDKLNLIADRAYGWYEKHSFNNYEFIFKKDTSHHFLKSDWYPIFSNDTSQYELVPHLTAQGVNLLYEESGLTYYFYGAGMLIPDRSKMDDTYNKKNVFGFTPCKVEEINGFALGLHTKNTKNQIFNERDSLLVRGLSLEINPFSIFSIASTRLNGPYADSLHIYNSVIKKDWQVKIKGVHISAINTINEMVLHGLNITGVFTVIDEIHGVSISGLNNFCYVLKGVSIAGLRNRATMAKGLQIGLYNKATDLRGFQIGLWNSNGKRSLPLINWQFKANKKKMKQE